MGPVPRSRSPFGNLGIFRRERQEEFLFRQKLITLNSFFKLSNLARMTEGGYNDFVGAYRTTIPYARLERFA
jgi:hypothetical protein